MGAWHAWEEPYALLRLILGGFVPFFLVISFVLGSQPAVHRVFSPITKHCSAFITKREAEDTLLFDRASDTTELRDGPSRISNWKTGLIVSIGLTETIIWIIYGAYAVAALVESHWGALIFPFFVALSWVYVLLRPLIRPIVTTPFDLFVLIGFHLTISTVDIAALIYGKIAMGTEMRNILLFALLVSKWLASLVVLVIVLGTPLDIPSANVTSGKIEGKYPEDYTTLWGWISFSWMQPLMHEGLVRTLNEEDVPDMSVTSQSKPLFMKFNTLQNKSLLRRLFVANRRDLFVDFVLTEASVFLQYASPFFLNEILKTFESPTPEARSKGYIYAILSFVCLVCKAQADAQHLYFGRRAATRLRSELMASVYDKALKRRDVSGTFKKRKDDEEVKGHNKGSFFSSRSQLKNKPTDDTSSADIGKVVNLMSGDANRVAIFVSSAYFFYGAPVEIIIAGTFLFNILGWAAFSGFLVLILTAPLNAYLSRRAVKINKSLSAARDKRMGVLNEFISSIKFIKFFAWEENFLGRSQDARKKELKILAKVNNIRTDKYYPVLTAVGDSAPVSWSVAPISVSIVTFLTYTVILQRELTVPTAFTAIAIFNMLRIPLNVIPNFVVQLLQASVSLKRIEEFLNEEEVDPEVSSLKREVVRTSSQPSSIGIRSASFQWAKGASHSTLSLTSPRTDTAVDASKVTHAPEDSVFELRDISVEFPNGVLSVITGPTASGKSALLFALLGEMTMLPEGQRLLPKDPSSVDEFGLTNSISYCAQTPWLQYMSIRENILFGAKYDSERYNEVLECCALSPDLAIFEDGDATEVGARGVTLSGGQKARVALARAAYSYSKFVLLDDVFAAVDSHTANVLWDKLFQGPLMRNRTVILVTHHLDLVLGGAHYLVRMLDGRIALQGEIDDLRSKGKLDAVKQDAVTQVEVSPQIAHIPEESDPVVEGSPEANGNSRSARKLVKDEERAKGSVKWSVYKTYLTACGYWVLPCVVAGIVLYQIDVLGEKLWIRQWGIAYESHEHSSLVSTYFSSYSSVIHFEPKMAIGLPYANGTTISAEALPSPYTHPLFYVLIYGAIALGGALVTWRILNRFGSDIITIDSSISASLRGTTSWIAAFIAAMLTVTIVLPLFLPAACVMGYFYYRYSVAYVRTGRDLRRMESNSRSPIFASFGELLDGIVTVRAYSAEQRFFNTLHTKVDATTKMWFQFWMANRFLLLHFDFLSATSILLTTIVAISLGVDPGTAGLCITSAMALTSSVYWTCRFITQLEMDTNAVERVVEYLNLAQEPPAIIESNRPPAYWPSNSSEYIVHVNDLVIKYAKELDPVIRGVTFSLRSGERIGLVGRTGSGKSTLALSFLRFVDPSEGSIIIDGIDIVTIGVQDLRSRVTLIPQDATLFSGTIRENLDPFEEHSDDELLDSLFRVQLITPSQYNSRRSTRASTRASSPAALEPEDQPHPETGSIPIPPPVQVVATLPENMEPKIDINLDTQVAAGGLNFSQGQRQLIAMARALLRQNAIVIMDEATSSIDFETDAKIQNTIRDEFKSSLLITIAHRLRTVIDYDRLIVLDQGKIVEMDTPANLICKEGGVFQRMCLKSGDFAQLKESALAAAHTHTQ
ncbi:multidrug resistance-associated ABC transporter [Cantharellus anzutake]|uniref:multidrug resistance-associated ABC transporter n=1 Tax=Cantharellus anzutake TaxID=1750568 RepID=UPI001903D753|nr:multidrug resistance-associated ABC transporter [Cantharellus anzutake]KAF8337342.1 multidrug resistance-associated ABC transporter [Cantharellus anzutake]